LVLLVALGLAAALTLAGLSRLRAGQADELEVFGPAPTFSGLTDQYGRATDADDLRGTVVVADFIYTSCTDVCPLLSARMRDVQDQLRHDGLLGETAQLVSFSVDPARDTPEVLRAYAERFRADAAWRFLTGSEDVMRPLLIQGFHLGVELLPAAGDGAPYEMVHSSRVVLIDRAWRIRAYYDGQDLDAGLVARDVRQLLR
jgi:protein SCO1/2